ncbi:9663_t:CDS:1, partial [Cetraspora pellucida]
IYSRVVTQLKNKNSFILKHHYISYKLALAAKNAAKQVKDFKLYEKIVYSIYSYFLQNVEHIIHLKIIIKNIGDLQLT